MLNGHVETYSPEMITGWAEDDAAAPGTPVMVDIRLDGELAARIPANLRKLHGDRRANGFTFMLPPALRSGRKRTEIAVSFTATGDLLANSPRIITANRPAKRIVCFSPAGRVTRHDDVLAYQRNTQDHIKRYSNTGDWMVYDSSLKLLSFAELHITDFRNWTDREVDMLNAEFDYCFLRGSNFVHNSVDWGDGFADLLGKLKIPAIPFSVGAQAPQKSKIELSDGALRLWKAFANQCASIGVRGTYTAEVFNDHGIKNVEIIGCPSLFRGNDPYLQVAPRAWDDIRKVAFNLRREVSHAYANDIARYLDIQKKMMRSLNDNFDLTVTCHGEAEEKSFYYKDEETLPKARAELLASGWFDSEQDPLVGVYENRLFYNEEVGQYDQMIRDKDMAIGFRVHGNLPAMANKVPSICVDYDTRSRELADSFDIPTLSIDEIETTPLRDLYRPEMFDRFNQNFIHNYRRMRTFLDRNGMTNNMMAA